MRIELEETNRETEQGVKSSDAAFRCVCGSWAHQHEEGTGACVKVGCDCTAFQPHRSESSGWSKEFPRVMGWYWMRGFRQYRILPVEVNGNKFSMMFGVALYDAADADEAEFTGPISPSDTEELFRLREEVETLRRGLREIRAMFFEDALSGANLIDGELEHVDNDLHPWIPGAKAPRAIAAIDAALNPKD